MSAAVTRDRRWGAPWTAEEDAILARIAREAGFAAAGRALGVTAWAAKSRAATLGVTSALRHGGLRNPATGPKRPRT